LKNRAEYTHPGDSFHGTCHEFLAGKENLTFIYKRVGGGDGENMTHILNVISSGEKEGRGTLKAEYLDFEIAGEYSKNILTCRMTDDGGQVVELIGECTKYGIVGWMGYTERGDAVNAWEYHIGLFERV